MKTSENVSLQLRSEHNMPLHAYAYNIIDNLETNFLWDSSYNL